MYKKKILLLILTALLTGCQAMSVAECQQGDWQRYGQQDGSNGYAERWQVRTASCAKQGIPIDSKFYQSYLAEYQRSIIQYCQEENIFKLGLMGEARIDACPEPARTRLRPIYNVMQNYINNKKSLEAVNKDLNDLESRLNSPNATATADIKKIEQQYRQKRLDYQKLRDEQGQIQREIDLVRP